MQRGDDLGWHSPGGGVLFLRGSEDPKFFYILIVCCIKIKFLKLFMHLCIITCAFFLYFFIVFVCLGKMHSRY